MGTSCSHPDFLGSNVALRTKDDVRSRFFKKYGCPRPDVEHVVVLMLENRTFDSMLGVWMDRRMARGEVKPSRWDKHARAGKRIYDYKNIVVPHADGSDDEEEQEGVDFPVWSADPSREDVLTNEALSMPRGHPAEKYSLLNMCVFEEEEPGADNDVTLGGFAQQYYEREMHDLEELNDQWEDRTDFEKRRSPAMHVFLPEQAAVFTQLGESFGVSDTYFSSAPCQTWPNRLFASVGHCYGYVNNLSDYGEAYDHDKMTKHETMARVAQFSDETIFNRLLSHGVEWSIYGGDYPLSIMLNRRLNGLGEMSRVYAYKDFLTHASQGQLPPFTWVEPQYLAGTLDGSPPTDMHPPHSINHAQNMIVDMYNAMRQDEEVWRKTLFIITCDEGVGVFDHVPPPAALPPKKVYAHAHYGQSNPFMMKTDPFRRYGTRVPCVLASPLLKPGSVVRPNRKFSEYPFDHTSILRTVFDLFVGPDCYLHRRDRVAPSFAPELLQSAREDPGPRMLQRREHQRSNERRLTKKLTGCVEEAGRKLTESGRKITSTVRGGCHSVVQLLDFGMDENSFPNRAAHEAYRSMLGSLGKDASVGAESHIQRKSHMWGTFFDETGSEESESDDGFDESTRNRAGSLSSVEEDSEEPAARFAKCSH
eukprot:TRINITY_DN12091_c0_g1_i2.p1 TRINITY_DN12091_c0_g1~~TRINITY_DN12091_c0_g1_i2.p1  ORF type:complete len:648 (+),score=141.05 TRINITY_DN12091_c0_g1_i2:55-1998(+)